MWSLRVVVLTLSLGMCMSLPATAEEAVKIGNAYALLNKPTAPSKGSIILIPGGDGVLGVQPNGTFSSLAGNQLVRTRKNYANVGLASLTLDKGVGVAAAIAYMRTIASPVVVVATSRGSLRVPSALAAKPDALVLTAAFLADVKAQVGSATTLPRTLVIHHKQDGCQHTPPSAVEPFKSWGGAKVTVEWLDGGSNSGNVCQARAYHGFNGLDGRVVELVARFAVVGR